MSPLQIDVAADGVRAPIGRARAAELAAAVLRAEGVRDAAISVAFVSAARIAALNWAHLRHRGPTDVITFELPPHVPNAPLAADIYIAPEVARENAAAAGCGVREEAARLIVHGVLHALGHTHSENESRTASPMWRRQERLLRRLWRPAPTAAR